ncbi:GntR family transcriptional regulator/MocR family aminotransferase [Tenacibaculum adriaticum]|uniref:GntR family transcriptional regulator/MocR family aminotransferase n=1 Tax=Tenacibaculum adriaticum TaxID=413713 RepID=A0A5S5DPQ5_9FLAO|nr:PLP-dependent aminotransferase family protein [Tenacibaculum adriaticum]TYP97006.1 GntR family transcriptional regulator/MocR family aminotransferase [Tenacibaculum adriaticum]
MFPYKTSFLLNKSEKQPLYLQLANQFIKYIKEGKLPSGTKLVGSRTLSEMLNLHRKTVVACYEELVLQGWAESIPKKGTFIHSSLPMLHQQKFIDELPKENKKDIGFAFYTDEVLGDVYSNPKEDWMYINDGISDTRLTPTDEIARIYRRIAGRKSIHKHLSYGSTFGNETLRDVLVDYLNKTRGLNILKENLLITRGSQMGIYLSSQILLKEGDKIAIGETNYASSTITFQHHKATVITVSVDENGIDTNEVEALCKKHQIKALYITSHHHHPTTVTLSAERRIHLLNLAKKYNFAIIEDDYDYDFNYNHAPILPLASHDVHGNVIYIGSVCKTVAPVFRIGYLIAPKKFINEASKLRRIIDRQGDALLELTFAEFVKSGDLDRHIRKVMKIYKTRRDLFCDLLQQECGNFFQFKIPKGGMAVWVKLKEKYSWKKINKVAHKYNLSIPNVERYDTFDVGHNSIRIGFASYNEEEIYELIYRLKQTMTELIMKEKFS